MPLYEYQCDACGNRFERIQKFSDPPVEACPACSGMVRKLLSSPAIQFKGSGWYITDYAKKSSDGNQATSKTGESSTGDASSSSGAAKAGQAGSGTTSTSGTSAGSGGSGSSSGS